MICIQESITSSRAVPCSRDKFIDVMHSPLVHNICAEIASLEAERLQASDERRVWISNRITSLKRQLPAFCFHAARFRDDQRSNANAIPSGLVMLDIDHLDNPAEYFEEHVAPHLAPQLTVDNADCGSSYPSERLLLAQSTGLRSANLGTIDEVLPSQCTVSHAGGTLVNGTQSVSSGPMGKDSAMRDDADVSMQMVESSAYGENLRVSNAEEAENGQLEICFVAITPSGHGLRIVAERRPGESLEAGQSRIAARLGIKDYDACTKDLARLSFASPFEYVLRMNKGLFVERDAALYDDGNMVVEETREKIPAATKDTNNAKTNTPASPLLRTIVEQLVAINGGTPEEGNRNNFLYALARDLRYACDFNLNSMLAVCPTFGLPRAEVNRVLQSAVKSQRKSYTPDNVNRAIAQAKVLLQEQDEDKTDDVTTDVKVTTRLGSGLPSGMPKVFKLLCSRLPESYRPAMIIASLPVLGSLASGVRFKYLDHSVQSLSFISCISAPAATGKSFIKRPLELLLRPIDEIDVEQRELEQRYKDQLRACRNSKQQPEDPHACIRHIPVSVSIAKLLQRLAYAEGKHLIAVETEIDTLLKSEKAGSWSKKSDLYRKAFDNDLYGQDFMSDNSFSATVNVYYNLCVTGTPDAVTKFFGNVEDGLVTRVAFASLPDMFGTPIPDFGDFTLQEEQEIVATARYLMQQQGNLCCASIDRAIRKWAEQKRLESIESNSRAMDILRRRAAVIGFRAAYLAYVLNNQHFTNHVSAFGVWVANYVLETQLAMFGDDFEEVGIRQEKRYGRGMVRSLLRAMGEEFTRNDLIAMRAKWGQSTRVDMVLSRWLNDGFIEQTGERSYRKLKKKY